jgi:hypothetical protein
MGEYNFDCDICGKTDVYEDGFTKRHAYISNFYLCYPWSFEETHCDGKTICNCIKEEKTDNSSIQTTDTFFIDIINLEYVLELEQQYKVENCILYKFLQSINDYENEHFHYVSWDFSGSFNDMISDDYSRKHEIHARNILHEDCYHKNKYKYN